MIEGLYYNVPVEFLAELGRLVVVSARLEARVEKVAQCLDRLAPDVKVPRREQMSQTCNRLALMISERFAGDPAGEHLSTGFARLAALAGWRARWIHGEYSHLLDVELGAWVFSRGDRRRVQETRVTPDLGELQGLIRVLEAYDRWLTPVEELCFGDRSAVICEPPAFNNEVGPEWVPYPYGPIGRLPALSRDGIDLEASVAGED